LISKEQRTANKSGWNVFQMDRDELSEKKKDGKVAAKRKRKRGSNRKKTGIDAREVCLFFNQWLLMN
jgi:hypothetical protein